MTRFLTLAEAAETMRCSRRTMERRIADGSVRSTFFGGKHLINPADLPVNEAPRTHRTPPLRVRVGGKGRLTQLVEEMEA